MLGKNLTLAYALLPFIFRHVYTEYSTFLHLLVVQKKKKHKPKKPTKPDMRLLNFNK